MKEVSITFNNIQSHENTHFVLKPGLNFILGEGNNIGKSAIFNVLIDIASNNRSPNWLSRIVRNGTYHASATFEFDSDGARERVVAWFHITKPGCASLFFEQSFDGGTPVRLTACPQSLIDALGLAVVPEQGLINFNSADSTQLLSKSTNESDSIISHIMTDSRVETMKTNAAALSRDVVTDYRILNGRIDATNEILKTMEYNPAVDEFFDSYPFLQAAAEVADAVPRELLEQIKPGKALDLDALEKLSVMWAVASSLQHVVDMPPEVDTSPLERAAIIKSILEVVEPADLKMLKKPAPDIMELNRIRTIYSVSKSVEAIVSQLELLKEYDQQLRTLSEEKAHIMTYLRENTEKVVCPVKGEVLFTNENCIPVGDGFTL